MSYIDYLIFGVYMLGVLAVGFYHFFRNKSTEDYYVGSRSIKASHVGLSIVATDVGGGFSIGLGGVGFLMGLAGSWLLFTGLVGAWLTAVLVIPKIKAIDAQKKFFTYPDFLRHRYNGKVALAAAVISGVGYLGFTGAQLLAGAKLASATILQSNPLGMAPLKFALLAIAVVTILYTVVGGLKAVIYTDTIQWIILLGGLIFVTVPVTVVKLGGISVIRESLPAEYFSLGNISLVTFVNWMVTIIPIWLVGMTLYQRMYACRDERQAKKAWYIAGVFEYPVMAFTGVFLGMCARVLYPQAEAEMALPMLIRDVLPVGVTGIVIASYFSAIMSTADSCLMASSGNFVNDILERYVIKEVSARTSMRLSMLATLIIGVLSVLLAAQFSMVLDAILYAYAFMVSGLFFPTLGAYFWRRSSSAGALWGMLSGGTVTLLLLTNVLELPDAVSGLGLDASIYGLLCSALVFVTVSLIRPDKVESGHDKEKQITEGSDKLIESYPDKIETFHEALIQHGPLSDRIYLMKLNDAEPAELIPEIDKLARRCGYSKVFAKVPTSKLEYFVDSGYVKEAYVPGFYEGREGALFLSAYLSSERAKEDFAEDVERVIDIVQQEGQQPIGEDCLTDGAIVRQCCSDDVEEMSEIYQRIFPTYPFAISDPSYIEETMSDNVVYFGVELNGELVALSSSDMDTEARNVELTDFATLPEHRGNNFSSCLLGRMEEEMSDCGIKTAYTIARARSAGMNITFARAGYLYGGRLINNTNISGGIESMNVWHKALG
ncbi:MAG: putative beta-lysine N-acetyltransferase [Sedimentisphaerales bacterium]|nr:putative beta-lysine N-acetyltransferase [Sedimentisphaerales bacterium]